MASYIKSKVKQHNRLFKLKWAKKALRTSEGAGAQAATLCGASVWFESKLAEFMAERGGVHIESFNTTEKEMAAAEAMRKQLPLSLQEDISLHSEKLSRLALKRVLREQGVADDKDWQTWDFIDFDTCDFFHSRNAKETLELCGESRMLALTICVEGWGQDSMKHFPEGMTSVEQVCKPHSVIAWVEARTNMRGVDSIVYRNPGSGFTMATIIFQRKEKATATDAEKDEIRKMFDAGKTAKEIAEITKLPYRSIASMGAWKHDSFKKLRKNF